MQQLLSIFLPVAMMILMVSLGLRLSPSALLRAFGAPKPYLAGLAVQVLGLPALALALAWAFHLSPPLTLGLMLVAASPGGVTSNYVTLLAKGSVPLSVAMTLTTSLIAPITLPIILAVAGTVAPDPAGLWKISLGMSGVALVPLLIGVGLGVWLPRFATALARRLDPVAKLLFLMMVLATFAQNWGAMREAFAGVGLAVMALSFLAPVLALIVGRGLRMHGTETRTIMAEASLQNVAITIFVASQLLGDATLALPGLIYAVLMNIVALLLIGHAHRSTRNGVEQTA